MKITYFGHSCFLVEDGGHSILFDPYENHSVPGLELPAHIETNEVFCSHDHADHNGAELIQSSHDNTWSVHFLTVPHDDESGKKRGFCRITCVDVNGVSVVHMGDIGRDLSEEEYERLKGTDILMIPVGGYYTIDAETAHQIVERLHPSLTLLMHYRDGKIGYDVLADITDICQTVFPECRRMDSSHFTYKPDNISVITLKPEQMTF